MKIQRQAVISMKTFRSKIYISENSHLTADLDAYINDAGEAGGSFRQGRLLLKRYLEEIGYSEHIMDVRSFRVKNLLGLLPQV